jgi:hypothetical protein
MGGYILHRCVGFLLEQVLINRLLVLCVSKHLCLEIQIVPHPSVPYADISVMTGGQDVLVLSVPFDLRSSGYKTREEMLKDARG